MRRLSVALLIGLAVWLPTVNGQQPDPGPPSVDGELLVKFRPDASEARRDNAIASRGSQVLRRFSALDIRHIRVRQGQSLQSAMASLQSDPDVESVQPNYIRHTTAQVPNDPFFVDNTLWGLQKIQAPSEWSSYTTGNGSVVIASIDTGVNYNHADLAANIWTNAAEIPNNGVDDDHNGYVDDIHGINVLTHSGDPMDDAGHGTHTSGTMAGVGNNGIGVVGVNWNAKIVACKFLNAQGNGNDAGAVECFNYIVWLKQHGVNIRVTNNSWGGDRGGALPTSLMSAMNAAGNAGILNVCAAGNGNKNVDTSPHDPASLPLSSIVSVAASDQGDGRAWFSNYGTTVHLAAPGVGITSTYGSNYASLDGTSMATPHVSGAAALVALRNPNLSPEGIKTVLTSTVDHLPQWSGTVSSGGRLNLFNAAAAATSLQTLLTTQVPGVTSYDGGASWELGTRFLSDVPGQVMALRYWKSPSDNGSSHIGHLWTGAGQLLATVTFTNETASGWQEQTLGASVTINANTPYVVSVNTGPNGRWAGTFGFFLTPLVNAHLTGPTGNNGLYSQPNAIGTFPTQTDQGVNFFRDIEFLPTIVPDTTAPTVSITQPAAGSQVGGAVTIAANATDDVGVAGVQFQIDGINFGAEVTVAPYSVVWDTTGATNTTHTLTAIARDAAGHTTPASVTVTVNNTVQISQTLLTTQVPAVPSYDGGAAWELGTRFVSDVAGQVTALRYWKSPSDNGSSHIGHLWTNAGQLLATVTFTNETASGWQQQAITPVTITASAPYVVSVNTGPNGRWAGTFGFFLSPLINGHLTGPTGAGLYSQANAIGTFPTQTDQGVNFFRDVVFLPAGGGPPDTTPPTVSITQPAPGQVSGAVTITANAQDDVGVTNVQFQIDGINYGGPVTIAPYSIVWDSTTATNTTHVLTAIAHDAANHATTSAQVSVTVNNVGQASQTLLTTQVPVVPSYDGGAAWELGTRFLSDAAGQVTALRYWKSPSDNGSSHIGHLWSNAGQLLATVPFTNETASGWQQQALGAPVTISPNTPYVVSVNTGPNGRWAGTFGFFLSPLVNGHLTGPTGAGLYSQANAIGTFPTQTDQGVNFFRDVVFLPSGPPPPDTTPPTVSITQPAPGQVSGAVTIAANAQDDVGVTNVQFQIDGTNYGGPVTTAPYSIVWDSTTATNTTHVLTAIAHDAAAHATTSAPVTVTVSNTQASQTLLTTQVPVVPSYDGGGAWELGTRFLSDVGGQVTALRYWKSPSDNGSSHIGHLWTNSGQLLATVAFTNETASGWQQQALGSPVTISASAPYVVSVNTGPNGRWAGTFGFFLSPLINGHLTGPTGAGLYSQANAIGTFPTQTDQGVNFFRDIVFVPGGGGGPLAPAAVQASTLTLRVDVVGQAPTHHNLTSAVPVGSQLLLVDQGGYIYRWDGSSHDLLTPANFPAGIFPPGGESVLNVAANAAGTSLFVMYSTFTAPVGIPVSVSPRANDSWQVLYQYDFNGLALSNPRAIRAFQVRSSGHTGGGLVVLSDGTVVCAIGDNGDAGEDGLSYAQDATNHLAKILRVNPVDGSVTVLAKGVRNVQRLDIDPNGGDPRLNFADLGGSIAEEINSVRLADLLGAPTPLNFGWGRHPVDGNAREGTFYISPSGVAIGVAPSPESGFVQPIAQFGRESATLIAVSGPVTSSPSFTTIRALVGDLPGGAVYALTGSFSQTNQTVFAVSLVNTALQPVTLAGLAGGRPDPRFFLFPDGTAGVLLEATGVFYRLTQISGLPDPLRRP